MVPWVALVLIEKERESIDLALRLQQELANNETNGKGRAGPTGGETKDNSRTSVQVGSLSTMAINAQELQGQWNKLRGQVKERWGQLTEDDLQIHGGNIDHLVGKIQQRTGETRESIERFLTDLTGRGGSAVAQASEAVSHFAQQAGDRLRDRYGDLADQARDRFDMAQDVVRHNPSQSVAAAFGVGLVAGLIVGLALRSR